MTVSLPPRVTKINRDGVTFVSSVDRTKYTMDQLGRTALYEIAKYLRRLILDQIRQFPGMRRALRPYTSTQYWVRRIEGDLQIGFKHDSWYGVHQELGTRDQPRRGVLRNTVMEEIPMIRRIAAYYLEHIEDELIAEGVIKKGELAADVQDD